MVFDYILQLFLLFYLNIYDTRNTQLGGELHQERLVEHPLSKEPLEIIKVLLGKIE
jgi:hypothetical protein